MTLLFFDGFDNGRVVPKPEWDGSLWANMQTGRDGSANGAVSTVAGAIKTLTPPRLVDTVSFGLAFKVANNAVYGATSDGFGILARVGGSNVEALHMQFDASGRLYVRSGDRGATIRATGSYTLPSLAWAHYQFRISTLSSTAARVQVWVNGLSTLDIDYTGPSGAAGQVAGIRVGSFNSGANDCVHLDDLYLCDDVDATATQGRPNNTVLGDLKVQTLLPTGPGDLTQWTPNTAVANWTAVDENPANSADYVTAATTGLRDLYAMGNLSTSTLAVYGVRAGYYAQKSDAGAAFIKPLLKQGNGTLTSQATQGLVTGTWAGLWGDTLATKADGTGWSMADVNALQVGIESA